MRDRAKTLFGITALVFGGLASSIAAKDIPADLLEQQRKQPTQ